jgi:hypothetical protein
MRLADIETDADSRAKTCAALENRTNKVARELQAKLPCVTQPSFAVLR